MAGGGGGGGAGDTTTPAWNGLGGGTVIVNANTPPSYGAGGAGENYLSTPGVAGQTGSATSGGAGGHAWNGPGYCAAPNSGGTTESGKKSIFLYVLIVSSTNHSLIKGFFFICLTPSIS